MALEKENEDLKRELDALRAKVVDTSVIDRLKKDYLLKKVVDQWQT